MADYIVNISDLDCLALVDDVFETLYQKNCERLSSKQGTQYFLNKKLPEIVFNLCKVFKLAPEARYFAVELFNAFANKYIQCFSKRKDKMIVFCSKSALYILVCIQISSKMSSHYKSISQRSIINQMNQANGQRRVTKSDIITTELEILQMVNYDLNFLLPLDVIDVLLYYIQKYLEEEKPEALPNCSKLKETCSTILELVYLRQYFILSQFYGSSDRFVCDQMLLSVAVISVAIFVVEDDLSDFIAKFLATKCRIDRDDILKLSCVIIEHVTKAKSGEI